MRRTTVRKMLIAGASALLLGLGTGQASAAPPPCDSPEFCEWDLDCFYVGPEGDVVWSCRIVRRCYC